MIFRTQNFIFFISHIWGFILGFNLKEVWTPDGPGEFSQCQTFLIAGSAKVMKLTRCTRRVVSWLFLERLKWFGWWCPSSEWLSWWTKLFRTMVDIVGVHISIVRWLDVQTQLGTEGNHPAGGVQLLGICWKVSCEIASSTHRLGGSGSCPDFLTPRLGTCEQALFKWFFFVQSFWPIMKYPANKRQNYSNCWLWGLICWYVIFWFMILKCIKDVWFHDGTQEHVYIYIYICIYIYIYKYIFFVSGGWNYQKAGRMTAGDLADASSMCSQSGCWFQKNQP